MSDLAWQILCEVADKANSDTATFDQLAEEVMELHLALRGKHADTPAMEWLEIATIAMNAFASYLPSKQQEALHDWRAKHSKEQPHE